MQVRVIKSTINYLELEVEGEEHTLGNLISGILREIKGVKFASYYQPHPLIQKIVIKILTDGSISPKEALLKAINNAKEITKKYLEEIKEIEKGS
ncbi:MAG: DNA-directed RNA polymerase subunit L [Sulfolobaceae archaeon]